MTQPSALGQGQAGGPGDYGWFAFNPGGICLQQCWQPREDVLGSGADSSVAAALPSKQPLALEMWSWGGISWDLGAFPSLCGCGFGYWAVGSLGMARGNRAAVSCPTLAFPHPGGPIPSRQGVNGIS